MTEANGVSPKTWRDPTPAALARLDMPSVIRRKEIAERMLREGAKTRDIALATKEATGTAIGCGTLLALRRRLEREAQAAKRRDQRTSALVIARRELAAKRKVAMSTPDVSAPSPARVREACVQVLAVLSTLTADEGRRVLAAAGALLGAP